MVTSLVAFADSDLSLSADDCAFVEYYNDLRGADFLTDAVHLLHGPGSFEDCSDCAGALRKRTSDVTVSVLPGSGMTDFHEVVAATAVHHQLLSAASNLALSAREIGTADISSGASLVLIFVDSDNLQLYSDYLAEIGGSSQRLEAAVAGPRPCAIVDVIGGENIDALIGILSTDIIEDNEAYSTCLGAIMYASLGLMSNPFNYDETSENDWRNSSYMSTITQPSYSPRERLVVDFLYSSDFEVGQMATESRTEIQSVLQSHCN